MAMYVEHDSKISLSVICLLLCTPYGHLGDAGLLGDLASDLGGHFLGVALWQVEIVAEDAGKVVGADEFLYKVRRSAASGAVGAGAALTVGVPDKGVPNLKRVDVEVNLYWHEAIWLLRLRFNLTLGATEKVSERAPSAGPHPTHYTPCFVLIAGCTTTIMPGGMAPR